MTNNHPMIVPMQTATSATRLRRAGALRAHREGGGTALRPPHHICRQVTPFLAAHVRENEVCSAQL